MGMLESIAARVAAGETVRFRPTGSSMVPLIRSRDEVVVVPVDPSRLEVGDIVLARVAGAVYLHLVSAVDAARSRVQISNNRGRVNGWTNQTKIYGICTVVAAVDGGQEALAAADRLPVVADVSFLLILAGGFVLIMGGFMWLAARIRRRGLGGAVMGPLDEVYRPTAHRSRFEIESSHERLMPAPATGDDQPGPDPGRR